MPGLTIINRNLFHLIYLTTKRIGYLFNIKELGELAHRVWRLIMRNFVSRKMSVVRRLSNTASSLLS